LVLDSGCGWDLLQALRRFILFGELKRIDPAQLSGPIEFVTAYTGRGFRLLLRGLDKFLTLYDGLTELQPLSAVLCVPLIFQAASFSQCFVSSGFFAQECKLNLMEQHIDYSFMDLWLCFYSSPERGEYGTR
jgi:hypothetical protein